MGQDRKSHRSKDCLRRPDVHATADGYAGRGYIGAVGASQGLILFLSQSRGELLSYGARQGLGVGRIWLVTSLKAFTLKVKSSGAR
jgi:hypothetical protein